MSDFQEMMKQQYEDAHKFERPSYTFHSNFEKPPEGVSDEMIDGRRYYTLPNGLKYPSITTILSNTKSERAKATLNNWKKRVGHKEAKAITKAAANRGTKLHKLVEDFLIGKKKFKLKTDAEKFNFKQVYPFLKRIGEIHLIEAPLYLPHLRIAGRVDLVAEFDGELAIIDFKTSTKLKELSWIEDYLIQETFYALSYSHLYDLPVTKIVTIMSVQQSDEASLFVQEPINFVEKLVARQKKYYTEVA